MTDKIIIITPVNELDAKITLVKQFIKNVNERVEQQNYAARKKKMAEKNQEENDKEITSKMRESIKKTFS